MNRYTIFSIIILIILAAAVVFFVTSRKTSSLANPVVKQKQVKVSYSSPSPSSVPLTPSYDPPEEINYDSATDLKKELDSVDPTILDSDFE